METLLFTLVPRGAFGSPLYGDTLFGQLCWSLRNRLGDAGLAELLADYGDGRPFAVVSDPFPAGHWPLPTVPAHLLMDGGETDPAERKAARKRVWVPRAAWRGDLRRWAAQAREEKDIWEEKSRLTRPHPHNSINRCTGTTGEGAFAPFTRQRLWFPPGATLECWAVHDPARLERRDLETALADVGRLGYGRNASTGLGRFEVTGVESADLPRQDAADAWLTLGPCAPQGGGFDPGRSHYRVFSRFGRHGDRAAVSGNVFKTPVLLARAGAVLTPSSRLDSMHTFIGRGLGGDGSLSRVIPGTVHQGYCPVVGIRTGWEADHG